MEHKISFLKRSSLTLHPVAQKLFRIMEEKKSNLALAVDVTSQSRLLELADALGPELCVLKTHVDILEDFTPDFGNRLQQLAEKHKFLIFEDRKFADIGQTVAYQYGKGIYKIAEWADLINAQVVPGPGLIDGLRTAGKGRGLLLIAEMSSAGNLAKGAYAKKAIAMGENAADFVMGYICQRKVSQNPGMIHFTPGVKLQKGKDALGQRYRTVDEVLIKQKSDVIIVGRDITHVPNPLEQAKIYREKGWEAHEKSLL